MIENTKIITIFNLRIKKVSHFKITNYTFSNFEKSPKLKKSFEFINLDNEGKYIMIRLELVQKSNYEKYKNILWYYII